MAVQPLNLVLGPATIYVGSYGTAEPADADITPAPGPPGAGWTDAGGTDGGVMFEIDGTYTDLNVDQIIMKVGARLTDLNAMVTTQLSEMTLSNINAALNQIMTLGSGAGYATADLNVGTRRDAADVFGADHRRVGAVPVYGPDGAAAGHRPQGAVGAEGQAQLRP